MIERVEIAMNDSQFPWVSVAGVQWFGAESRLLVTPAVEARLNERQRKILAHALENGSVTTGWSMGALGVVQGTAHRDLAGLVELGLLTRKGSGRTAGYMPKESGGP